MPASRDCNIQKVCSFIPVKDSKCPILNLQGFKEHIREISQYSFISLTIILLYDQCNSKLLKGKRIYYVVLYSNCVTQ